MSLLAAGLDARAAAIVMRTVRNIVNTGRTIVCTIHQPSIDIFESFDELLLLKRGGQTIYAGDLPLLTLLHVYVTIVRRAKCCWAHMCTQSTPDKLLMVIDC